MNPNSAKPANGHRRRRRALAAQEAVQSRLEAAQVDRQDAELHEPEDDQERTDQRAADAPGAGARSARHWCAAES